MEINCLCTALCVLHWQMSLRLLKCHLPKITSCTQVRIIWQKKFDFFFQKRLYLCISQKYCLTQVNLCTLRIGIKRITSLSKEEGFFVQPITTTLPTWRVSKYPFCFKTCVLSPSLNSEGPFRALLAKNKRLES